MEIYNDAAEMALSYLDQRYVGELNRRIRTIFSRGIQPTEELNQPVNFNRRIKINYFT